MATLYPSTDTFVRGEISPRLHARASLDLYRAGLARCLNYLTLPHGGLRRRGGSYFAGEVKTSADRCRLIPFIFSSEQAYVLEVGNLYMRVYAYGARVGTVEITTPWATAELNSLQYYQSADKMWLAHPDHALRVLTREAHETWTIEEFTVGDGPYDAEDTQGTKMTPSNYGAVTATMTTNTAPSGTVTDNEGGSDAFEVFDRDPTSENLIADTTGWIAYDFAGTTTKIADAYWITGSSLFGGDTPGSWYFEGDDGSNWIVLDRINGETEFGNGETRFYEFVNETAYRGYRLRWTAASSSAATSSRISEIGIHERAEEQTPFNLTASSTAGINGGTGFTAADVGRAIRLMGSDGEWRWARIVARTSSTVVTIRLYHHSLPDLAPISRWQLGTFVDGAFPEAVAVYEERLALARRYSAYLSKTFLFDDFGLGEADDDGLEFRNAGGGQANDIVWIADGDGFLLLATTGGVRALSGSGVDEALTPSSFKNRKSRTHGAARVRPVDAGSSFIYVTRSRKSLVELSVNQFGRFTSDDVGQVSEHIPKRGVYEIAYQQDPDPILWFVLDDGEMGGFTHQPSQEVRGMHRHLMGGDTAVLESVAVTPGADGMNDDVWLLVKRTIDGGTKRYIELLSAPLEDDDMMAAFAVDSGLSYEGVATGTVTGLSHLEGQTVDVLADVVDTGPQVFKGLVVATGSVTLPDSLTATHMHVGLPYTSEADTLELDVGARDGSLIGRRKRISKLIMSLLDTDLTGLEVKSLQRGRWENVKIKTVALQDDGVSLYTGNVEVPIDDSWEGMGKITIRHTNPTPCTIRAITPVFDAEP